MKGRTRSLGLLAAIAFTVAPAAVHAADDISVIVDACAGCHGTDARSPGEMPGFSDKTAEKIAKVMLEYKSGEKEATIMDRVVKGYSEAQLQAIAEEFAARNSR